ncbi:hypothetical protein ENBRE01_1176 [Enteropsectra breve]|nr:hypothetical protein ENBRE01_1176 [Enteropsectra breve]
MVVQGKQKNDSPNEKDNQRAREILSKDNISAQEYEELLRLSDSSLTIITGCKEGGFPGVGIIMQMMGPGNREDVSESSDEGFYFSEQYDTPKTGSSTSCVNDSCSRPVTTNSVKDNSLKKPNFSLKSLTKMVKKNKLTIRQIFVYSYNLCEESRFSQQNANNKIKRECGDLGSALMSIYEVLRYTDFYEKVMNNDKETIVEYLRYVCKIEDLCK